MFLNRFAVTIVSNNKNIEEILRAVPQPEDSDFTVTTVPEPIDLPPRDSAVIIDWSYRRDVPEKAAAFTVLLCALDDIPEEGIPEKADDLWVMPARDPEKMLRFRFGRLMDNMKKSADNRKLEICFRTAIDSIPDLVWFKDTTGAHLIVNNAFCKAVEKTKEQIYKQGHYYIWDIPKSEYEEGDYVCLESEDEVMQARKTCLFDEKVKTKSGMRQFKTYKSPLIDRDDQIIGTCGVAHDITDLQNTNNELDTVLESMPYAVIVSDRRGLVITTNSRFKKYFPEYGSILGSRLDSWRAEVLTGHTIDADGNIEITRTVGGEELYLVFGEEPITDIFGETIGTLNIFRDVTLERKFEEQTLKSANTDFLTGLHNRRSLFSYLGLVKRERQLSMITVDLDNFKKVNDTFGHQKGDEALVATSRILEESFPHDFIARLGGDEFLIAIIGERTYEEMETAVKIMFDNLCRCYKNKEEFSMMSVSAGIAMEILEDGAHDIEKMMINSDSALYAAKNSGKAAYRFYNA